MGLIAFEIALYLAAALPYVDKFRFSSFHSAATLAAIALVVLLHVIAPSASAEPARAPPYNLLGTCAAAATGADDAAAAAGVRCLRMRDARGEITEFHDGAVWRPLYLAGVAMAVLVVDICWSSVDWSRRAAPARARE